MSLLSYGHDHQNLPSTVYEYEASLSRACASAKELRYGFSHLISVVTTKSFPFLLKTAKIYILLFCSDHIGQNICPTLEQNYVLDNNVWNNCLKSPYRLRNFNFITIKELEVFFGEL